jgi:hypothetical protein
MSAPTTDKGPAAGTPTAGTPTAGNATAGNATAGKAAAAGKTAIGQAPAGKVGEAKPGLAAPAKAGAGKPAAVSKKPASIEGELRAAVEQIAARAVPERGPVTELIRMHASYHSVYPIDELSVGFADGSSLQLVFKDLCPAPGRQAPGPRRIRPSFLCDARREIATYRGILRTAEIGAPRFYGAVEDEAHGRHWLFLEDVPGEHLWQFDYGAWVDVARWLAGMHRRFEGRTAELAAAAPLLRYDEEYFALWILRAAEFRPTLRRLMAPYQRIAVRRLGNLPVTFIHGEFYASNVLMQDSPWGLLVRPIDWEMAGIGSGLLDLAALAGAARTDEQRLQMARAYYDVYVQRRDPPPFELFLEDLDFCRLHLAIQWLGWSDAWKPPTEHAQDWLSEADDLAKKLGVL